MNFLTKRSSVISFLLVFSLIVPVSNHVPFLGLDIAQANELELVEIATCSELQAISSQENNWKHYRLTQDINCVATSISDTEDPDYDADLYNGGEGFIAGEIYNSIFDGAGYTIRNLSINRNGEWNEGLFRQVNDSVVHDLILENFEITAGGQVGALAGYVGDSIIANVAVYGAETSIRAANVNSVYLGGLIGRSDDSVIRNVSFSGEVDAYNNGHSVGGLIGHLASYAEDEGIFDSYANATVSGGNEVGGLVGTLSVGDIKNSYAVGAVDGLSRVGGFIGYISNGSVIENNFANASVVGNSNFGAFIGTVNQWINPVDMSINNNHYDDTTVGGMIRIAQSDNEDYDVTAENEDGEADDYFYSSLNVPLTSWDFDTIWLEINDGFPTHRVFSYEDLDATSVPRNVSASTHPSGTALTLVWDEPSDAGNGGFDYEYSRYEIEIKLASDEWEDAIASDTYTFFESEDDELTHTASFLQADTEYDFRIRAIANVGALSSDWVEASASTPAPTSHTITTCEQLQAIGNDGVRFLIDSYTLGGSIDCSATSGWNDDEGFAPIGSSLHRFMGDFDGAGYTISNLFIDRSDMDYVGLFGVIEEGVEIYDLGLVDVNITGDEYVGALAGALSGTVTNVYSTGSVNGDENVGGLVGQHIEPMGEGESSPLVFTWNGEGYEYVADVGGALPRSVDGVDYAHINKNALTPKDDAYSVKISQEYNEVVYYDELALVMFDHAPGFSVVNALTRDAQNNPDAFITVNDTPTHPLLSCTDMYDNDCVEDLRDFDEKWSYRDESEVNHFVLDFGDLSNEENITLVLRAARDFSQEIGRIRTLEVVDENGNWTLVYDRSNFGVDGTPRLRALDLTDKFISDDYRVRVFYEATSVNYFAIDTTPQQPFTMQVHYPESVNLGFYGYTSIDKTHFWDHDYEEVSDAPPELFATQSGKFTRYGDVTPLLESTNDQFVIMRHGDQLDAVFPYIAPEAGKERSFMLFNNVLYKHAENGSWARTVDPLPYQGMTEYPSPGYPMTAENSAYLKKWNTRTYHGPTEGSSTIIDSWSSATVEGDWTVGGLVGFNEKDIIRSYATGDVHGSDHVGGLVGRSPYGEITQSYATGDVSGSMNVGGFIGGLGQSAEVNNSYARGRVTIGGDYWEVQYAGAFAGRMGGTIINSYATGFVENEGEAENVGGFIGAIAQNGPRSAVNSFWDIETTSQAESARGTGKTTAQMKTLATFTTDLGEGAWDFEEVWVLDAGINNGYPYLGNVEVDSDPEPEPEPDPILGCTNSSATNYNASATVDNGSCTYRSTGGSSSQSSRTSSVLKATPSLTESPAQTTQQLNEKLRTLIAQFVSLGGIVTPAMQAILDMEGGGTSILNEVRDLEMGMEGDDVRDLQTLLRAQGYSIPAGATGYFATQTRDALAKYQSENGITPSVGYFGPVTRAEMKSRGLNGLWW